MTSLGASAHLDDAEFLACFEDCSLPVESFRHADHVRLAWLYVRRQAAATAVASFENSLRRFAEHHGAGGKYHATITWFYVLAIQERVTRSADADSWPEFARQNPDLLDWQDPLIARYYPEELLRSPLARQVFVLPGPRTPR